MAVCGYTFIFFRKKKGRRCGMLFYLLHTSTRVERNDREIEIGNCFYFCKNKTRDRKDAVLIFC